LCQGCCELVAIDFDPVDRLVVQGREIIEVESSERETGAFTKDLDLAVAHTDCHHPHRHLAHCFRQQSARDDRPPLLHHLDGARGSDCHFQIGSGHLQPAARNLAQHPLEHGQSGSACDRSIGPQEQIGQVVALGSDSHNEASLLDLWLCY
jgi:hypothetical protein